MNFNKNASDSFFALLDVSCDEKLSFEFNRDKKYHQKMMIYETGLDNVTLSGRGSIMLSNDNNLNHPNTLKICTNNLIENILPRPSTSININLNGVDLTNFNYIGLYVYVKSTGHNGFYFHFATGNDGHLTNHAPFIYPNTYQYVEYNISHIVRDNINTFKITPYLMGCPDEALPNIEIYIDSIFALKKDDFHDIGFKTNNKISYCHSGYHVNGVKQAIIDYFDVTSFKVIGDKTYTFKPTVISNFGNKYLLLDFTMIKDCGYFYIKIGNITSDYFEISDKCYYNSILKSLNFLRSLRCGEDVPGVHCKCHLNCRTIHEDGSTVPNFGGWHDAGDLSQFEIPTAEITSNLLDLYDKPHNYMLSARILAEAKVGLSWLAQTRFGDGYRAMQVHYGYWRSNKLSADNKTVITNHAERGAFENALSALAFIKGYFASFDDDYLNYLKRLAISDFEFATFEYFNDIYTPRWGKTITSQTLGVLLCCASLLYKATNDNKYLQFIIDNIETLLKTQMTDKSFPLYGFFFEDTDHKYILSYEHRGHEEYPILGLCYSYEVLEDGNLKDKVFDALNMYKDFIINSISYTIPYNLIPGGIYNINKVNYEHFTIPKNITNPKEYLKGQIENGIHIKDDYYLRIMPISFSRRGFHTTLLSKTKGVSYLAKVLNSKNLKDISTRQIEWILGLNPFSTSTMYGEGYNYHNLYVAFSKQLVGALPVGFMTKGDLDAPYWPDYTNAVFKEIWGHTTGKFLAVLADVLGD